MLDKLYPYQRANAETLARLGFGCDLSSVGTGKTLTALGVMEILQKSPVLVIAPKSVSAQWELKFKEFYPDMGVYRPRDSSKSARHEAYKSFAESLADPKALIVTYEQARLDVAILYETDWGIIYADECHRLGNPLTKAYKAIKILRSHHRFGATATPLRSSPLQAYGIFNWLNPGSMGKNYWHFKAQYVVTDTRGWGLGYKNLDHLAVRIKPYYVKTTMEEAGLALPPLIEEDLVFSLGSKAQKLYELVKKEILLDIEKIQINKIENPTNLYLSVVKLGKLQEICDSMELVGGETESAKIDTLKDSLQDTLVGYNKALLFTRFRRMADILARELKEYNPAVITGTTKDGQEQKNKFRFDPTCKVVIGTTALSEGVDGLQEAGNLLYMIDVPLGSYGMLTQIRGRLERHGQQKKMTMIYMMASGTVDIKLKNLLLKKQEMSEKIFGSLAEVRDILE